MSGIFSTPKTPGESEEAKKARERAEQRAEAAESREAAGLASRVKARRTGGLRMLFSPIRQEGPQPQKTKLGGGSD